MRAVRAVRAVRPAVRPAVRAVRPAVRPFRALSAVRSIFLPKCRPVPACLPVSWQRQRMGLGPGLYA